MKPSDCQQSCDAHVMQTTPRCRMALKYAGESLSRFGHSHMSGAHVVLGLLTLGNGIPYNLLSKAGLTLELVEGYLSSRRTSVEGSATRDGVRLGRSALSAFERAEAEAQARGTYLGTDHLLLGILAEESGEAADLFASIHIDREKLRRIIEEEIQ